MLAPGEHLFAPNALKAEKKGSAASPGVESASRRAGKAFEARVQADLAHLLGPRYLPGPWFSFNSGSNFVRVCQPDGILELPRSVLLIEIKLQHTIAAWYQLRQLYQPVVERAFRKPTTIVEIFRSGDILSVYPEPVLLIPGKDMLRLAEENAQDFFVCYADTLKEEKFSGNEEENLENA